MNPVGFRAAYERIIELGWRRARAKVNPGLGNHSRTRDVIRSQRAGSENQQPIRLVNWVLDKGNYLWDN